MYVMLYLSGWTLKGFHTLGYERAKFKFFPERHALRDAAAAWLRWGAAHTLP